MYRSFRWLCSSRINRNILECKGRNARDIALVHFRINRNILECKGRKIYPEIGFGQVLIETYWNVKNDKFRTNCEPDAVLIETYWNVKIRTGSMCQ